MEQAEALLKGEEDEVKQSAAYTAAVSQAQQDEAQEAQETEELIG